jgi:hypothetical protein
MLGCATTLRICGAKFLGFFRRNTTILLEHRRSSVVLCREQRATPCSHASEQAYEHLSLAANMREEGRPVQRVINALGRGAAVGACGLVDGLIAFGSAAFAIPKNCGA